MGQLDEEYGGELSEHAGPAPTNPMRTVLYAIGRYPASIAAITVIGAIVGLLLALSQPNYYRSVGMLLVRIGERELQTPESAIDPDTRTPRGSTAAADELFLLMDPALLERVAERVGPERILEPYNPSANDNESTPVYMRMLHGIQSMLMGFSQDAEELPSGDQSIELLHLAADILAEGIELDPQRRSNTILVSYTAHSEALAQLVASTYMQVLQERHREFYEISGTHSFLKQQLDEANSVALQAREALLKQRKKDGLYNLQTKETGLSAEIDTLTRETNQGAVLEESLRRQLSVLSEQLSATPQQATGFSVPAATDHLEEDKIEDLASNAPLEEVPAPVEDPMQSAERTQYTISTLRAELQRTSDQLARLDDEYAPSSPYHQRRSSQLRNSRSRLEGQLSVLLQLAGLENQDGTPTLLAAANAQPLMNPVYTQLLSTRFDLTREIEALKVSSLARSKVLAKHREELEVLIQLEPTYARLERQVEETSQQAASVVQALSKSATLKLIASEESMGNLRVTQEPYLPRQKEGPDRLKTLIMGLFGGFGLGMIIALARQLLDTKLRYRTETESALGIRVLGVIPEQATWDQTGKELQALTNRP